MGGRFSIKTLDTHLAAIRDFERSAEAKGFATVTPADAARYRQHLVDLAEKGASRSTIKHRSAFLAQFFRGLLNKTVIAA